MEPEIPANSTQIGQDARGVIGKTVIGATVIYGSVTIIQGSQAPASEDTAALAARVGATAATPSATTLAKEGPNPYQGLLAFQPSDGDRFFGRDAEIEDLWQRFRALHEQADAIRLLVVYGPSGSGKSSLVRAGLVPELARRPPGGRAQARIALLVPGSQPLQALASVLARIATNDPAPVRKTREFAEELALPNGAGEHDGLQRIAAVLPQADVWPMVVVVDQLEELYSLCPDASVRQSFLANLLRAAADRSGQVAVVLTLRSDFLGATQADPALNQLIQAQGLFVAALSEQGLRDAIRLPAERSGRPLDVATVQLLVEQSLGRDGALPLLQFALLRIWEGLLQGQPAAETLRQIGGVGGALAGEADRIQASLPPGDQRIARRLFLNLVQLGEGSRDTRRRVSLQEVIAHGEDLAATRRVLERFASPAVRLITRSSGQDGTETLELSHEALIEAWPLLRDWLNSSRADLLFQRRLEEAACHWKASGQPEGSLWRPPDLDLLNQFRADHEADLTTHQIAFADASLRGEQERLRLERDQRRLLSSALGGGLLVVSIALMVAWGQLLRAQHQRGEALAATAKLSVASRPADALLEALAAVGFSRYGQLQPGVISLPPAASEALIEGVGDNRERNRLQGHQGSVFSAAFSHDRSRIVSASQDGTLRLWDAKSGKALGELLRGHQGPVSSALFSNDGGRIVSAGEDGTVRLWDAKSGKPIGEPLRGHQGPVWSVGFSADSSRIVSAGEDGTVRVWGAKSGKALGDPVLGSQGSVRAAAFSADMGRIVSAGGDGTVRLWDAKSGKPICEPLRGHQDVVWSAAFSADGGRIVTASQDGTVRLWDAKSCRAIGIPLQGHQGPVVSSAFSADGGRIVSAGDDGTVRVWDARSGLAIDKLMGHQGPVVSAAFSIDGGRIVTASQDGTVRLWDVKSDKGIVEPLRGHRAPVVSAVFNADGGRIVTASMDGTVRLWDAKSGKVIGEPLRGHQGSVRSAVFSTDGGRILSARNDGTVRLWDAKSGREIGEPLRGHQGAVVSAAFSVDGGRIVSAGDDGTVRLWDAKSGRALGEPLLGHVGYVMSAAFTADGGRIVSAGGDGTVRLWNAKSGKMIGEPLWGQDVPVWSAAFSTDGGRIVTAAMDGTVRLWDAKSGKAIGEPLRGHQGPVRSAVFSADGGRIVSAGHDGTVRLWDAKSRRAIGEPLRGHIGWVWSAAFSPDGGRIVSAGNDGTVRRWLPIWSDPIGLACRSLRDHQSLLTPIKDIEQEARSACQRWGWR